MKRLMNFLRGMADLRVTGLFPERLINLCAQNGVEFWGVEWLDEHTLRLTVRRRHLGQGEKPGQKRVVAGAPRLRGERPPICADLTPQGGFVSGNGLHGVPGGRPRLP